MDDDFIKPIAIDKSSLRIKRENILKSLEVPPDHDDPYLYDLIDELIALALQKALPKAQYVIFEHPRFENNTEMYLNEEQFHLGKIVSAALNKSSHLVFFLATAGKGIEDFSKQLIQDGNSLEGLIVDLAGSEIAEELAEISHQQIIQNMLKIGLGTSNRYSPGYCNWPVSDQQKLFRLFKLNTCDIELTESSLMLPIKSVSGIIGAGKNVKYNGYSCKICDTNFCIYREKR